MSLRLLLWSACLSNIPWMQLQRTAWIEPIPSSWKGAILPTSLNDLTACVPTGLGTPLKILSAQGSCSESSRNQEMHHSKPRACSCVRRIPLRRRRLRVN
jgi:hypothetical protein